MKLWTLTYDCGDYYCDGEHLVGVFESQEAAQDGQQRFLKGRQDMNPGRHNYATGYEYAIAEIELGKVYL